MLGVCFKADYHTLQILSDSFSCKFPSGKIYNCCWLNIVVSFSIERLDLTGLLMLGKNAIIKSEKYLSMVNASKEEVTEVGYKS